LAIGPAHFLPPKIHSNFNSSDKFTKFLAIPIISISAPLKIFALPCTTPNHSTITYLSGYGWLHFRCTLVHVLSFFRQNFKQKILPQSHNDLSIGLNFLSQNDLPITLCNLGIGQIGFQLLFTTSKTTLSSSSPSTIYQKTNEMIGEINQHCYFLLFAPIEGDEAFRGKIEVQT